MLNSTLNMTAQQVLQSVSNPVLNSGDPNSTLAAVSRQQQEQYRALYVPVEDAAIASLRDTSIIDDAAKRVADTSSIGQAKQRAAREAARYGFRRTAAQNAVADNDLALNKATGDAGIMNEARLNQFDRNTGFRNELINIGRGLSSEAMNGLGTSAEMQTNRENANRTASAAASAQNTQMLASAAALAIMVL